MRSRPRPQDMVTRLGTIADVAAIRDLSRAAYAKWVPVIGREPLPMAADYDAAIREHRIDLLELDGTLVALVETITRVDHLWVENISVSPNYAREGLGRLMIDKAEEIAAEQRFREIRLATNKAFAGNVEFYLNAGFTIDREEPFRNGIAVYFRKSL